MDENHKTIHIKGLGSALESIALAIALFAVASCTRSCIHDENVTRQIELQTQSASHK